jgi:RNA polymerase sigma factor (sigma-70 family)
VMSTTLVRKAVYELTYRQRQLIQLVYYENVPVPEAAKLLGMNAKYARRILQRGRERLKELLSPTVERRT